MEQNFTKKIEMETEINQLNIHGHCIVENTKVNRDILSKSEESIGKVLNIGISPEDGTNIVIHYSGESNSSFSSVFLALKNIEIFAPKYGLFEIQCPKIKLAKAFQFKEGKVVEIQMLYRACEEEDEDQSDSEEEDSRSMFDQSPKQARFKLLKLNLPKIQYLIEDLHFSKHREETENFIELKQYIKGLEKPPLFTIGVAPPKLESNPRNRTPFIHSVYNNKPRPVPVRSSSKILSHSTISLKAIH